MGWLLAALSGLLAALSYPSRFGAWELPDLGWLAWLAWVPFFCALRGKSLRRTAGLATLAGFFHYGVSQYWIYSAVHGFGGLSVPVSVVVMLLHCAVLTSFFALAMVASQWVVRRTGWSAAWVRPLLWLASEYLRNRYPAGGHPWSQLGYSQSGFPWVIQIADLAGVYGVTALLMLAQEFFFGVWESWGKRRVWRPIFWIFPALLFCSLGYGYFRFQKSVFPETAFLNVGLVQGNIPQDEKWSPGLWRKNLQIYTDATRKLAEQNLDLILWPEASLPKTVAWDGSLRIPGLEKIPDLLIGAITYSREALKTQPTRQVYNSALLVSSEGQILDHYHKQHLVPFGEYVPYREILFFAKKMTAEVGDLRPGLESRPLRFREHSLGVSICYEDIFPEISRALVKNGAQALINLTNDAWYGWSSAAKQHQVFSQFRSVETRRATLRVTNSGISALILPTGRVVWQGGLFERSSFVTRLPLNGGSSVYLEFGDWLPRAALVVSSLLILFTFFFRKRSHVPRFEATDPSL